MSEIITSVFIAIVAVLMGFLIGCQYQDSKTGKEPKQ